MTKIIKRKDIFNMNEHSGYIKECCEYVHHVYSSSIYFFSGAQNYFSWDSMELTIAQQDFILNSINGICKTKFVFDNSLQEDYE